MECKQQDMFKCENEHCFAQFMEIANLEKEQGLVVTPLHCRNENCHDISFENEGGAVCTVCKLWICKGCKRELEGFKSELKPYCPRCETIVLLRRNPRNNFDPDAPVEIEYQFVNEFAMNKKRRVQEEPSAALKASQLLLANAALHKDKTLLEVSWMPWPDIKPDMLALKYPHDKDERIWLDETENRHLYYVKYDNAKQFETENNLSTSSVVHKYSKPYDAYDAVDKMLAGKQWGAQHPKWGKYFDRDEKKLPYNLQLMLKEWKQNNKNAIQLGKFVHFLIECHCNGKLDLVTHPLYSRFKHIQQYVKWRFTYFDPFYEEYRTEFRFFSCGALRRVGTCDLLAVRRNHPPPDLCDDTLTVSMFDWKNAILNRFGFRNERMLGPCSDLEQCNVAEYTIQQSDYAKLAMEFYSNWRYKGHTYAKIKFESMQLIGFHEENPGNLADIVPLVYIPETIDVLWNERYDEVQEWEKAGRPPISYKKPKILSAEEELIVLKELVRKNDATNRPRVSKTVPQI